jgi:hypothetical protein
MTANRDVRVYLDDMLENLRLAREFTGGLTSAAELAADPPELRLSGYRAAAGCA